MTFGEQRGQRRSWFGEKEDENKLNIELMYEDIKKQPLLFFGVLFHTTRVCILKEEEYPETNKLTCVLGSFPGVWSSVLW